MSVAKSFAACSFSATTKGKNGMPSLIKPSPIGTYKATSFFIDSSGHSSFLLPLELKFASQEDLDTFLASKCLKPSPSNMVAPSDTNAEEEGTDTESAPEQDEASSNQTTSIGFEVKSYSVDETKDVIVEAVSIQSTSVKGLVVYFDTELNIRATNQFLDLPLNDASKEPEVQNILANLEVTPVLTIRDEQRSTPGEVLGGADLMAFELGAIPDHMQKGSNVRVHETRLSSITLDVTLTHAFTIAVKSVPGPSMGSTMISLSIRHSNSHREPVTISNVAIHPGHSRYENVSKANNSATSKYSVTNMTKAVQWAYAPQTELHLPLTLNPHDAYSTVLVLKAGEEMRSRLFTSPVSVTGVVGQLQVDDDNSSSSLRHRVVVAADAHWATDIVAVEPADAFRIDMNLESSEVLLGQPLLVKLRIFNLSLEPRNLMLLMAKEELQGASTKDELVNSAVVSEISGYTFGVWGISGEDDGTVPLNRDQELLAVDGALLLGEVLGQHAVDAELRFVPLREGRLKVPDWKLYDKSTGKWYTCVHNLCMIAKQK